MCVELKVYDSFKELADFQSEWDGFVEANGADIFMTYDWCRIWWKYYGKGRRLHLCVFRDKGNELVGIMPLFSELLWAGVVPVKVVKIVGSDFTNLSQYFLPIRIDLFGDVISSVVSWLGENKFDVLQLGDLSGQYSESIDFDEILSSKLKYYLLVECYHPQAYFSIPATFEEYLGGLSKNERRHVKRSYRDISKIAGIEVGHMLTGDGNLKKNFDDFCELHKRQWQCKNKLGHFGDWPDSKEFQYEFSQAALEKGRLRLLKIAINDTCLGYDYDYLFGGKYYAFLNAKSSVSEYKDVSLGRIIFCERVKDVTGQGVDCIDSLKGHFSHKIRLGASEKPATCLFVSSSFLGGIKFKLLVYYSKLVNLIYYKIWFLRLAPKLISCEKRKPLCKLWIKTKAFAQVK